MTVSISTSNTMSIRNALERNLSNQAIAGQQMATGSKIIKAYMDTTGAVLGGNIKSTQNILQVVSTGIQQSKSMIDIAEQTVRASIQNVDQLIQIIAKSQIGYMTDDLIQKTLAPTYNQLTAEADRLASSAQFNGQSLLDGTAITTVAGTSSTITNQYTPRFNWQNAVASLNDVDISSTIITATTYGAASTNLKTGLLTIDSLQASVVVQGGEYGAVVYDGSNNPTVTLTNATVTLSNVNIKDTLANQTTGDLTITGVTLIYAATDSTLPGNSSKALDAIATSLNFDSTGTTATVSITLPMEQSKYTFSGFSGGNIQNIELTAAVSGTGVGTSSTTLVVASATKNNITNVTPSYTRSGGSDTVSSFKFLTGDDFADDVIYVKFANIKLTNNGKIKGFLSTINDTNFANANADLYLSKLQSSQDALSDLPLLAAYKDKLMEVLSDIGAIQQRFMSITEQLNVSVEQQALAAAEILDVNLAQAVEDFARNGVKVVFNIASITQMIDSLTALQRLIQ